MYKINVNALELARAKKGKTLKSLGIDPNILVRARKGRPLRASTVFKLADCLDCSVEELISFGGGELESINTHTD